MKDKSKDLETFEIIGEVYSNYAKDKNQVYYYGRIIENADPETFEVISSTSAKDKNNAYDNGRIIISTESEELEV